MPKKTTLIHAPKTCGGEFLTQFNSDNCPFLECQKCGHTINDWIKWYQEYSRYHTDPLMWGEKKHELMCLLGLFCDLYKKCYEMPYPLSMNANGLFHSTEVVLLRRLLKMNQNDVIQTKNYIEWIFHNKVKLKKKRITSISFMCVADLIQEFKFAQIKAATIDRNTPLPTKMLDWINHSIPTIHNYVSLKDFNDLNIMLTHYRSGTLASINEVSTLVAKLREAKYIDDQANLANWRN